MSSETVEITKAENRIECHRQLAAMLREWMTDPQEYDEEVWPYVEDALNQDGIILREPDEPST